MFGNVRDELSVSKGTPQRAGNLAGRLQTHYEKPDIHKTDHHAGPLLFPERKMLSLICCVTVFFALGGSMVAAASHAYAAKTSRPTVDTSALEQKDPFACVFIDNGKSSYGDYIYSEMSMWSIR